MDSLNEIYTFTTTYDKIVNTLTNEAYVETVGKIAKVTAQWDTGATNTCISHCVVQALSLIPIGYKTIHTPSGESLVHTYLVNITLPNRIKVVDVEVCDSEIGNQNIGVLIGMDIIGLGDFMVSNYNGSTAFSFRIPSIVDANFVEEFQSPV